MAGKSSALCLIGPEKAVSASIRSPIAIATEPILLDVSTANIKGFGAIRFQYPMFYYFRRPCYGHKKRFLGDFFLPVFPDFLVCQGLKIRYYRPGGHKSNFSLAKRRNYVKLDYYKCGVILGWMTVYIVKGSP